MISILHGNTRPGQRRNLIIIVSGIQIALALGILFLPLFGTCMNGQPCSYQNYIQMGGSVIGFGFLGAFILLGGLILAANQAGDIHRTRLLIGLNIAFNLMFAVIGAWSFGLAFLPVALLMMLAIRSTKNQDA